MLMGFNKLIIIILTLLINNGESYDWGIKQYSLSQYYTQNVSDTCIKGCDCLYKPTLSKCLENVTLAESLIGKIKELTPRRQCKIGEIKKSDYFCKLNGAQRILNIAWDDLMEYSAYYKSECVKTYRIEHNKYWQQFYLMNIMESMDESCLDQFGIMDTNLTTWDYIKKIAKLVASHVPILGDVKQVYEDLQDIIKFNSDDTQDLKTCISNLCLVKVKIDNTKEDKGICSGFSNVREQCLCFLNHFKCPSSLSDSLCFKRSKLNSNFIKNSNRCCYELGMNKCDLFK